MRVALTDVILGCLVGGAIGDAAGSAFENSIERPVELLQSSVDWRLTDDTQLTLATCEAIASHGIADPSRIAEAFLRWFRERRLTGLGSSTLKALRDLDAGAHWALAGCKGDRAAGNGAAMRIAPLAFCLDLQADDSRQTIRDVCRITHHHEEAYVGALAVVLALDAARRGVWSLERIAVQLPDTLVRDKILAYAVLPKQVSPADAGQRFGASGYVVDSAPLALYAAQQVGRIGFSAMLEQVIAAGGDTDTNASLACQIAGAGLGLSGLPPALVESLPQAEMVQSIARVFAETVANGPLH